MSPELYAVPKKEGAAEAIPQYQQEWLDTIAQVVEYAENRERGLNFGFDQLNEALYGLNPVVHYIAGQPNIGKSALCLQLAWQVAKENDNAYVLYFSLDDSIHEMVPRIISLDQRIPIACIKYPKSFADNTSLMTRRAIGFKRIQSVADRFKLRDSDHGFDIESIEEAVREHLSVLPEGRTLCIFIDNFYNIEVRNQRFTSDDDKAKYLSKKMKAISKLGCPVVCTAELRKINSNRRPTLDDLLGTVQLQYDAKCIILCYNEVGIRNTNASIFWNMPGSSNKEPVLEVVIAKNKLNSFKGRLFYHFWPTQSFLSEVPPAGCEIYNNLISV